MQLPIYFFGDNHFSPNPSLSNELKIKKLEQFIDVIKNSKFVFEPWQEQKALKKKNTTLSTIFGFHTWKK